MLLCEYFGLGCFFIGNPEYIQTEMPFFFFLWRIGLLQKVQKVFFSLLTDFVG